MEFRLDTSVNPWNNDDALVGLKNALKLAEKTGHVFLRNQDQDEGLKTKIEHMPSKKMIDLQKELTEHNRELHLVNLEIQKRMMYMETKDILDISVITKRVSELREVVTHLQSVLDNKEFLLSRLQQPFVGEYVKVDAHFHRHAYELFRQLAPILSDLTSHLDDLAWVNGNIILQTQLEEVMNDIATALANLQTGFQSLSHVSHCISSLQSGNILHTSFSFKQSFNKSP